MTPGHYVFREISANRTGCSQNCVSPVNIETVQEELLTEAKNYTKETDDFKILMNIQYYGGKTNLIEFTTDYLIALFSACSGSPHKDGKVILQKTEKIKNLIYYPCSKTRNYVSIEKIVCIRPPKGFIQPNVSDVITIPKNLKQSMLEYLQKAHGISTETIYNNLYGFVMNHTQLIQSWVGGPLNFGFFLRVAVMEVESWVMADQSAFAEFLKGPIQEVPAKTDEIPDPKASLLSLAEKSKSAEVRKDLLPKNRNKTSKIGPGYNNHLCGFENNPSPRQRSTKRRLG